MIPCNVPCILQRASDSRDLYGKENYGPQESAKCTILKHYVDLDPTTVRSDAGGSRKRAREVTGRILVGFKPAVNIKVDDKITIAGRDYRVEIPMPIYGFNGCVIYVEADCVIHQTD